MDNYFVNCISCFKKYTVLSLFSQIFVLFYSVPNTMLGTKDSQRNERLLFPRAQNLRKQIVKMIAI